MKTYSVTEFKAKALQILGDVASTGNRVLVTKHGSPLVEVVPARQGSRGNRPGTLTYMVTAMSDDLVKPVFPEWGLNKQTKRKIKGR